MTSSRMALAGWYDYRIVALSILVAICASYSALDLAGRVTAARGRAARALWLIGGAAAMGFGIWSMHFTGMLAFHVPVPVDYYWPTVLLSLVVGVFSSALALYMVSRESMGAARILIGSVLMGSGIAGLHYIAMAAMRLAATMRFDLRLVTLSVMLAILFSAIALRLAFYYRKGSREDGLRKVGAAIVMGAAVSGMHYTGMAAASFIPSAIPIDRSDVVRFSALGALGLVTVALIIQGVAIVTSLVDRRFASRGLELQSSEELSARVLRSQDEERRRIARELHDTTGQALLALKMNLAKMSRSNATHDPTVAATLSDSLALVEQCISEIRTLSHLLHPPMLEEAGLASALRWYAAKFEERSGIKVSLEVPPELERLPDDIERAVFRIVQECLTNIHRHSGSAVAKIRIRRYENNLKVEVEDEGRGMPARVVREGTRLPLGFGVGIAGMQERIQQLGGRMEIHSNERGTKVTAVLPIDGGSLWQKSAS